jgi:hypothetical protein
MSAEPLFCFNCNKPVPVAGIIGRRDECPHCRADVHVCRNCEFYDPKVYNECRETQADVVKEKDRANFCDYLKPRLGQGAGIDKAAALRAAAEALFRKK